MPSEYRRREVTFQVRNVLLEKNFAICENNLREGIGLANFAPCNDRRVCLEKMFLQFAFAHAKNSIR